MGDVEKFLKEHTGFCIFPIYNEPGRKLCGAITYEVNGEKEKFCPEHIQELKRLLKLKRNSPKVKHKPVKVKHGG